MSRRFAALFAAIVLLEGAALAKPCPNIMLVLDQSASMLEDPYGKQPDDPEFRGQSKWELLREVVTAIVKDYGARVPFGLLLYSGNHNTRPPYDDDLVCFGQNTITAPVAHEAAGAILKAIQEAQPNGNTGTNGAIHVARSDPGLMDVTPGKHNFIVLVTDGNPNCGTDAKQTNAGEDLSRTADAHGTLDEIYAAYQQKPSIKTFVIGFDGDPNGVKFSNLDNMGFEGAGGGTQACTMGGKHCYYTAGVNFADFRKILGDLIDAVGGGGEFDQDQCDDSCYSNPCPPGQRCAVSEVNQSPHCEPDQCMGAKCDGDTFCRRGECVKACDHKCEDEGAICVDGECLVDLCAGKMCAASQVCNPKNGSCIDYPCLPCNSKGAYCNPVSGKCSDDGCRSGLINCPAGTVCVNHENCQGNATATGCACTTPGKRGFDAQSAMAYALLLLSVGMLIRRRSRPMA